MSNAGTVEERENMMKRIFCKILCALIFISGLVFTACNSWMTGDDFFGTIADEVKYANAEKVNVFIRYPSTNMGETSPNGNSTQKVDIPFTITAVDSAAYGFYKWAAFTTEDYSTIKQYNILFNTEEEYQETYAVKELPGSEVYFEDENNPVTTAKILTKRNDVYIMPICVRRPYIMSSIPADNATGVVKNTAITIVFSRPMDRSQLIAEDGTLLYGNSDYIAIQPYINSGEIYTYRDIDTDLEGQKMTASLSSSGRTLTIRLPEQNDKGEKIYFNPGNLLISLSRELRDTSGFTMASDVSISFSVVGQLDTTPPMVHELEVGAESLTTNGASPSDPMPHVGSVVNVRTWMSDRSKENEQGSSESAVTLVRYTLERLSGADSTEVVFSGTGTTLYEDQSYPYVSGTNFTTSPKAVLTDEQSKAGVVLAIDIDGSGSSASGDGLFKLTVWGEDVNGNVGNHSEPVDASSHAEAESKCIYFIKDTKAPEAISNSSCVSAESASAPYGWYNEESVSNKIGRASCRERV